MGTREIAGTQGSGNMLVGSGTTEPKPAGTLPGPQLHDCSPWHGAWAMRYPKRGMWDAIQVIGNRKPQLLQHWKPLPLSLLLFNLIPHQQYPNNGSNKMVLNSPCGANFRSYSYNQSGASHFFIKNED
jgi:hypothetical protein